MDPAELRTLFLFEGLTQAQLVALADAGEEVTFAADDVVWEQDAPADHLWVLLEGALEIFRRSGRDDTPVAEMTQPGQWAGGFRAWSDNAGYMGSARGLRDGRLFRLPAEALGAFLREWSPLGAHLIGAYFQTVRNVEVALRQRAGLVALGTLAAGLAHEINNPAAAAARGAETLRETTDALQSALVQLAERAMTAEQFMELDRLRREIEPPATPLDSMSLMDREDELQTWLDAHGVEEGWRLTSVLAGVGVDAGWCDRVAAVLDQAQLGPGLDWVANTLSTSALLTDVATSTRRVSALVEGVKSYSQLDRASLQRTDVVEGIESTLGVLAHKLGSGITITRDFADDLPMIEAHAAELNQVWTNLIDNAVDAMDGEGTLTLHVRADDAHLVVEVADTGPGMPDEVQARAFEPFFTTKDVGHGTGLGLDISRRIVVDRHQGEITVDSVPGKTVMRVLLPRER